MKPIISSFILLTILFIPLQASSIDELDTYEQHNNTQELQQTLQKAQEGVNFTFSPWLKKKNKIKSNTKTKYRNSNKKAQAYNYTNKYNNNKSSYDIKFKAGLSYKISSGEINILYKTDNANDILNLNKDLAIDKFSNSIGVPIIHFILNQKHNFYFSSLNYSSSGTKIFKDPIVFNGRTFKSSNNQKINSKFEYSEYDFKYSKDFGFYNLGVGYKNLELQTTIDDTINIERATSTITFPYITSSLKTVVMNKKLDFIGEFSFFNKELYYKVGSNLYFKNLIIGINYEGYDYKYTNLESTGNNINLIFSYLINFN